MVYEWQDWSRAVIRDFLQNDATMYKVGELVVSLYLFDFFISASI